MKKRLQSLWRYRQFVFSSIKSEIRSRFARSRIGGAWMILHPLAQVLVYVVILSGILAAKLPGINDTYGYAIYISAGMLAWSLFSELITRCLNLFNENAGLMKKMAFPRATLPAIAAGGAVINNIFLFVAVMMVSIALGKSPGFELLWMPILLLIVLFLGLGLGLILGILNVFIRDIGQIVPVILNFGFWFTPVVYARSMLPEQLQPWLALNPLLPIVEAYHAVLVYHKTPDVTSLLGVGLLSLVLLLLAGYLFKKASPEMVDAL